MRWRAVGTCFSQHTTEQNRSFIRPVLQEATVQRTAAVPGGISLRQVAQTRLAMPLDTITALRYPLPDHLVGRQALHVRIALGDLGLAALDLDAQVVGAARAAIRVGDHAPAVLPRLRVVAARQRRIAIDHLAHRLNADLIAARVREPRGETTIAHHLAGRDADLGERQRQVRVADRLARPTTAELRDEVGEAHGRLGDRSAIVTGVLTRVRARRDGRATTGR